MNLKYIITSVIILVIALTIFSYIFNPEIRYQTNTFFLRIGDKISNIGISNNNLSSNFRCEEELKGWLRLEKIKNPSSVNIKVIEKKSFTNKTELLDYINGWGAFNEYEIEKQIEDITKMPEAQGDYDLTREDNNFILDFDYEEGEIKSMRLLVTKGFMRFGSESICDKTIENNKGRIECDVSKYGEGTYRAEAYIDEIEKIWEGKIDVVLIKEEGEIDYNNIAILIIGICEDEGELKF